MKKLFKKIAWLLKGAHVCRKCGRPITEAEDIEKGYGPKCFVKKEKEIAAWLMGDK